MSHITVADLTYAHPGGDPLFEEVSFGVSPGVKAALVGNNGVGKTTLLRVLAGELAPENGTVTVGGSVAFMRQDVGIGAVEMTIREMLLGCAASNVRAAGLALVQAEHEAASGDQAASIRLAQAIGEWGDVDGYGVESTWDSVLHRIVRRGLDELDGAPASQLSGGERKQVILSLLFDGEADVLVLDEPDNFLDIPAKQWLEGRIDATRKTVLMVSHDRQLLRNSATQIVTLESNGAWVHGASYDTYADARERRQRQLGDALTQWKDEERRLFRFFKIMKERAKVSDGMAPKAAAAESRWERFVAAGPPPPPAPQQQVTMRLQGADSGRRVLALKRLEVADLTFPFSAEVHHGERIGLIGPNGSGKTHLLRLLAGHDIAHRGDLGYGARVTADLFTQTNQRPDFAGLTTIEPVVQRTGNREAAMKALARYGLAGNADQSYQTLSGGQKARLEILVLELDGANLLLLDEPTDNLDTDSAVALENALDGFEGTLIAVSHDRVFLSRLDHYWLLDHNGFLHDLPDWPMAQAAIAAPDGVSKMRHARQLTHG